MMYLWAVTPYGGISVGGLYMKRNLSLKDIDHVEDTPQCQQFTVTPHVGIEYKINPKFFIHAECFGGKTFRADYFEQNWNIGGKVVLGFYVKPMMQVYVGCGVDFAQLRSLKVEIDNDNLTTHKAGGINPQALDYQWFMQIMPNIGCNIFVSKSLSVRMDICALIGRQKTFQNMLYFKKSGDVVEGEKIGNQSSSGYIGGRATIGLQYFMRGDE